MTVKGTDREYKVRVDRETMESAVKMMRRIEEPITPYGLEIEAEVNPERSKAIVLYLWKKGILKPRGYRKSKKYDSINFEMDGEKTEELLAERGAESDPEQVPNLTLIRNELDL